MLNILKMLVHMFRFKVTRVNQLQTQYYAQLVTFSQLCMDNMSSDSGFLLGIVLSDECVFHISGFANTHKTRIKVTEKPREIQLHELQSKKVTCFCAAQANGVVGL